MTYISVSGQIQVECWAPALEEEENVEHKNQKVKK